MSKILSKTPWPDDSMKDYFVVDTVGSTLVNKANGRVLSRQPGGSWADRDPGTSGPWETYAQNGVLVTYNPDGQSPASFLLLDCPNV